MHHMMERMDHGFKDLTPEQIEKVSTCKTPEDILALAKEEGYELTDEELSQVVGGGSFAWKPSCELSGK